MGFQGTCQKGMGVVRYLRLFTGLGGTIFILVHVYTVQKSDPSTKNINGTIPNLHPCATDCCIGICVFQDLTTRPCLHFCKLVASPAHLTRGFFDGVNPIFSNSLVIPCYQESRQVDQVAGLAAGCRWTLWHMMHCRTSDSPSDTSPNQKTAFGVEWWSVAIYNHI